MFLDNWQTPSTTPTMSTRFMGDPENKETTCDHRVKVYAFQNALPLRSNDDKKAKMTQKKVGFELEDLCATVFRRLTITRALFFVCDPKQWCFSEKFVANDYFGVSSCPARKKERLTTVDAKSPQWPWS